MGLSPNFRSALAMIPVGLSGVRATSGHMLQGHWRCYWSLTDPPLTKRMAAGTGWLGASSVPGDTQSRPPRCNYLPISLGRRASFVELPRANQPQWKPSRRAAQNGHSIASLGHKTLNSACCRQVHAVDRKVVYRVNIVCRCHYCIVWSSHI